MKILLITLTVFVFTCSITLGSGFDAASTWALGSVDFLNDGFDYGMDENFYNSGNHHENFANYQTSKHVFYWFYTRNNTAGQLLNRSEPHMTESTTYDPNNPIKVIIHGWLGTTQEKSGLCSYNVQSYFKVGEYNLICVDWKQYSTDITYAVAKARSKYIALDIVKMLLKITYNMTEGCYDSMHMIGHSMGAHIAGHVGKNLPGLYRISGLDPARPMYEKSGPGDRLDFTDAIFVDVMHTNAGENGLDKSIGHMDFYPNGGSKQPNCSKNSKKHSSCSHVRSYRYFVHSIWSRNDYIAYRCPSWDDFEAKKCDNASTNLMGEWVDKDGENGDYYLDACVQD